MAHLGNPDQQRTADSGPPQAAEELLQRYASGERNFAKSVLRGACLDGAVLRDANFEGADLTDASFRQAILERVNLAGVIGLMPYRLAGANVREATLPSSVAEFGDLKRAQQLADSAQKLFLAVLGACAYTVLTVVTIRDPQLMLASVPIELPVIRTPVPTVGFFWVAPLVLAGLFVYLHLYLQRLWETLGRLPAILPDGAALDERVDPWLMSSLIRRQAPRLREDESARVPWLRMQDWAYRAAAWWIPPLTLAPLWWRYLTRHDWIATTFHIGLIVLLLVTSLEFQGLAGVTLRGVTHRRSPWPRLWRDRRIYQFGAVGVVSVGVLWAVSYAAIEGTTLLADRDLPNWLRPPLRSVGSLTSADLYQAEAWPKPKDWEGSEKQIAEAKEVDFKGRDFRGAILRSAFLVKVNLRGGQLQGAYLTLAQLQKADLSGAQLQKADLSGGQLQGAVLFRAQLQGADLSGAQLQEANLRGAQLQGADLFRAQLQKADLSGGQLQGAVLFRAQLQKADLSGAQLQEANLRGAQLQGADLEGARCLTAVQLEKTEVDLRTTRLPIFPTPCP